MSQEQMSQKDFKKVLKKMKDMPPPIIERTDACLHRNLTKFVDDGIVYQCDTCRTIFEIFGAASYTPEVFLKHALYIAEKIQEQGKSEEKSDPEPGGEGVK